MNTKLCVHPHPTRRDQNAHTKSKYKTIAPSNASLPHPSPLSNYTTRLSLSSFQELHVLLRVGLLNIVLSHLLHHEVGVNVNLLAELATSHTPLAADGEDTNGGFGVNEGVDTLGDIGEGELVGCLRWVSAVPRKKKGGEEGEVVPGQWASCR